MEKEKIGSLTEKKLLKKRMSKLGRSKEFFLVKKKISPVYSLPRGFKLRF